MWLCLILGLFYSQVWAQNCSQCIGNGQKWCGDNNQCISSSQTCNTAIKNTLNCPLPPNPNFSYNDSYARSVVLPLIAAVYSPDPVSCLRNQIPSTTYYQSIRVQCRNGGPNSTCHAYVAYDQRNKFIAVSFEGTEGSQQWIDEISSFFDKKQPFFGHGHVYAYFYNAFFYLWNGGLQTAVRNLMYLYPDYSLLSVGHSLGGSIATVFASYAVQSNLWTPNSVRLMTFGQPRTGDQQFALWHDETFLYSYRIVHHTDPVPHLPPLGGPDEVWHHRFEVWYNNNMKVGSNFTICQEADGPYCSNSQTDLDMEDHVWYFDKELNDWADRKCP